MNSMIALPMYTKGITAYANLSKVINIKERGGKILKAIWNITNIPGYQKPQ